MTLTALKFYDHCRLIDGADGTLLTCHLFGRVVKEDKNSVTVLTYDVMDDPDATETSGREGYTILKSAIISRKKIRVKL